MKKQFLKIFFIAGALLLTPQYFAVAGLQIQPADFVYKGAFRVPAGSLGGESVRGDTLGSGGAGLTYNPANNSLFIMGKSDSGEHPRMLVEISIPAPVDSESVNDLNFASKIQDPADVTNDSWNSVKADGSAITDGAAIGGFMLYANKLVGSVYGYYDADGSNSVRSHFKASPSWSLSGKQFEGLFSVGAAPAGTSASNGGFVGGYMSEIPAEWKTLLGANALTGQGAIPIITRSSYGPSLWTFNPEDLSAQAAAAATMLIGYPSSHPTLGNYGDAPSVYFNRSTDFGGVIFPEGADNILIFGNFGIGTDHQDLGINSAATGEKIGMSCYGLGSGDISQAKTNAWLVANSPTGWTCGGATTTAAAISNGDGCCYDPLFSAKGGHAYPYVYYAWSYKASDLLKIKNGDINPATDQAYEPWEIIPEVWQLNFPHAVADAKILGATYDPSTKRVYLAEGSADGGTSKLPIIQVFEIASLLNDVSSPAAPSGLSVQ